MDMRLRLGQDRPSSLQTLVLFASEEGARTPYIHRPSGIPRKLGSQKTLPPIFETNAS